MRQAQRSVHYSQYSFLTWSYIKSAWSDKAMRKSENRASIFPLEEKVHFLIFSWNRLNTVRVLCVTLAHDMARLMYGGLVALHVLYHVMYNISMFSHSQEKIRKWSLYFVSRKRKLHFLFFCCACLNTVSVQRIKLQKGRASLMFGALSPVLVL